MTLDEMELALARFDTIIRILKKQMKNGTNPQATPEVIALFQEWRDDLDIRIGLERISRASLGLIRCRLCKRAVYLLPVLYRRSMKPFRSSSSMNDESAMSSSLSDAAAGYFRASKSRSVCIPGKDGRGTR